MDKEYTLLYTLTTVWRETKNSRTSIFEKKEEEKQDGEEEIAKLKLTEVAKSKTTTKRENECEKELVDVLFIRFFTSRSKLEPPPPPPPLRI